MENLQSALVLHGGAGACSPAHLQRLKKELKAVLRKAKTLKESALLLEASGAFNCGSGGSTTSEGAVENECCLMESTGEFSALCIIPRGVSPYEALQEQIGKSARPGAVRPLCTAYAPHTPKESPRSETFFAEKAESEAADTVGVIQVQKGHISAYSSSGGPVRKTPGRIGPCSVYGANTFVSEGAAVLVSGTGESLIRQQLARRILEAAETWDFESVKEELEKFVRREKEFPHVGGVCVLSRQEKVYIVHFQTAASFVFGYSFQGRCTVVGHAQKRGAVYLDVLCMGN
ncbi:L-asparaginase / beta-aspartyl-peptidase [Nematocida major]|uniref:L-asparaginase / beta-aspartyl-peptidase n=1 Tax=Nematocida major TaxID=1912982 RepID=UPI002008A32B|nr:L-asparaginase / beta-aspartyl-peptidase [Nematocida major]KAH9385914.1 L-asparaginase / beta-aspartyl-peptidase [Nematocida major]